jgi:DNA-directed RNA polymerase specialized sigma24 family protein
MAAPAKPEAGLTLEEQKRLAEAMNRLTPEERKRLTARGENPVWRGDCAGA